jgi:hypothetical protein
LDQNKTPMLLHCSATLPWTGQVEGFARSYAQANGKFKFEFENSKKGKGTGQDGKGATIDGLKLTFCGSGRTACPPPY